MDDDELLDEYLQHLEEYAGRCEDVQFKFQEIVREPERRDYLGFVMRLCRCALCANHIIDVMTSKDEMSTLEGIAMEMTDDLLMTLPAVDVVDRWACGESVYETDCDDDVPRWLFRACQCVVDKLWRGTEIVFVLTDEADALLRDENLDLWCVDVDSVDDMRSLLHKTIGAVRDKGGRRFDLGRYHRHMVKLVGNA